MNSTTTLEEVWALFRETDRRFQDTDRKMQDTDRQLKEKLDRLAEEAKERQREAEQRQRETDRQLRELGKQIGGLGNKFGSFTEGLALPSMEKILRRRFGVDTIAPSVRVSRGDRHLELDVLAYANGAVNAAYVEQALNSEYWRNKRRPARPFLGNPGQRQWGDGRDLFQRKVQHPQFPPSALRCSPCSKPFRYSNPKSVVPHIDFTRNPFTAVLRHHPAGHRSPRRPLFRAGRQLSQSPGKSFHPIMPADARYTTADYRRPSPPTRRRTLSNARAGSNRRSAASR